ASAFDYKDWNDTASIYQSIVNPNKFAQKVKETSPIYEVSSDDPPVLIIHGDADKTVPLQQSESIIKRLKEANVPSELIIKNGGGHGWKNIEVDEQNFVTWFNKYLK
ncbi:MAG: prolyl oligopeptidase family serine peptidase, partial [Bacteroidota bacterium]|nr:prolyl oligopeptidase family serine peptidase [Bacteroidota bacterium]